jgi:hypothetical protein
MLREGSLWVRVYSLTPMGLFTSFNVYSTTVLFLDLQIRIPTEGLSCGVLRIPLEKEVEIEVVAADYELELTAQVGAKCETIIFRS